ncbi:MAG: pilus assembly protein PilB [Geobacteraceae bacterium]|nr:pilus assembly protein PilB [Geobacteraceae bacterium]
MDSLVKKGTLGTILFTSGIIKEQDIAAALEEQRSSGCRFGEALVRLGIVMQEDIDWALSNQLGIPYVRLSEQVIDRDATRLISPELARKFNLIPIIRSGEELHIALADPLNRAAVEEVELITGCRVTVSIPIIRELREMLDLFYGPAGEDFTFGFSSSAFFHEILEEINSDSTGAKLLDCLVLYFFQNGLSTLSLQPAGGVVHVSGRIRGNFRQIGEFPVASYPPLITYLRKVSKINGSREPATEGRLVFAYNGCDVSLNISMIKAAEGECITLKQHPCSELPADLGEMGLRPAMADRLRSLSLPGAGMVIFSSSDRLLRNRFIDIFLDDGAAHSGNVILLGEGIGRGKQPYPRIPLADADRTDMGMLIPAILDHDPDVMVVEDITDGGSFNAAWEVAMRGKKVVAGISRSGLDSCLAYLLQARFANSSVSDGISGVVAITEVKTLCPHCRERVERNGIDDCQSAAGCAECSFSGFGPLKYLLDVVSFDEGFRHKFSVARESSALLRYLAKSGYSGIGREIEELLTGGEISRGEYDLLRAGLGSA